MRSNSVIEQQLRVGLNPAHGQGVGWNDLAASDDSVRTSECRTWRAASHRRGAASGIEKCRPAHRRRRSVGPSLHKAMPETRSRALGPSK